MENKVLIVVDMQNDFIDGALGTKEAQAIVPNVKKKIEEYKARGDRIIFTRDTHYDNYLNTNEGKHLPIKHCTQNTHGWQIANELEIANCEHIDKPTFGYTEWASYNFDGEIELIGLVLNICVISNAIILKALYPESTITVNLSCTAATSDDDFNAAIRVLHSCQINTCH